MDNIYSERVWEFRQALEQWNAIEIVQRYITVGDPIALLALQHVELKQRIAAKFVIHHIEVFVVGSAKLGFSIAPTKRWRQFNDTSDLDVAIVSRPLYEQVWREVSNLLVADPLIGCVQLIQANLPEAAMGMAAQARTGVERALAALHAPT
jgi:hypothetical protein